MKTEQVMKLVMSSTACGWRKTHNLYAFFVRTPPGHPLPLATTTIHIRSERTHSSEEHQRNFVQKKPH